MYDALTNFFSIKNIGQVMSLKNELRDMQMNDDDSITSYFVRISQLRDQLHAIEEIKYSMVFLRRGMHLPQA